MLFCIFSSSSTSAGLAVVLRARARHQGGWQTVPCRNTAMVALRDQRAPPPPRSVRSDVEAEEGIVHTLQKRCTFNHRAVFLIHVCSSTMNVQPPTCAQPNLLFHEGLISNRPEIIIK